MLTIVVDGLLVNLGIMLSFLVRFGLPIPQLLWLNAPLAFPSLGPWGILVPRRNFLPYQDNFLLITFFMLIALALFGLYERDKVYRGWGLFFEIAGAISLGFLGIVALTFFSRDFAFPRSVIVLSWGVDIALLALWRVVVRWVKRSFDEGFFIQRALVVGVNGHSERMAEEIDRVSRQEHRVVGFISQNLPEGRKNVNVLGGLADLPEVVKEEGISEVIIALPADEHRNILEVVSKCEGLGVRVYTIPDLYEMLIGRVDVTTIGGVPLIELDMEPIRGLSKLIKRLVDITVSASGLMLLAPLMSAIFIMIKISSPGPALLRQERVGKNGRPFTCVKFRSMVKGAEADTGPVWASPSDRRITRLGRILRRFSLDELPQLWNVLVGEMSLAGPRPERGHFVSQYEMLRGARLSVKPGMTGLAQVNGRYNLTIPEKVEYDLYYIRNYSLILDIKILLKTVSVVLRGEGVR
jgi:exopolysaccharide biosynthesis polyprenyl glycosylphosphotransferase